MEGRLLVQRGAKRIPPVYRGELDARHLLHAQCGEEEVAVRLGAALAAYPDRPVEVADGEAIMVSLPGGHLVHADRPRHGEANARQSPPRHAG